MCNETTSHSKQATPPSQTLEGTVTTENLATSISSPPTPNLSSISSSSSFSSTATGTTTTTTTNTTSTSKWKIKSTPQDSSLIPTLGVTCWMGWNFVLIFLQLYLFSPLATSIARAVILIAFTISSLVLPADFLPFGWGTKFGDWMLLQGEKYFGLTTIIENEESLRQISDQNKAAIFSFEPHDMLPYPVFAFNPALQRLPGKMGKILHCLTSTIILKTPFIRHIYTWVRCSSVDKNTFRSYLQKGESVVFVPGGVHELTHTDPSSTEEESKNEVVLYLKKRKGFVKLALENGSPIVPVFGFNIEGSYGFKAIKGDGFIAKLGRSTGVMPIFFWGRFGIPFGIPRPNKITVAIGQPIDIPKISSDDDGKNMTALVDKYHTIFVQEMEALFERHKASVGWSHKKLNII